MRIVDDRNPQMCAELARAGINPIRQSPWARLFPTGDDRRPVLVLQTVPIPRVRSRRRED